MSKPIELELTKRKMASSKVNTNQIFTATELAKVFTDNSDSYIVFHVGTPKSFSEGLFLTVFDADDHHKWTTNIEQEVMEYLGRSASITLGEDCIYEDPYLMEKLYNIYSFHCFYACRRPREINFDSASSVGNWFNYLFYRNGIKDTKLIQMFFKKLGKKGSLVSSMQKLLFSYAIKIIESLPSACFWDFRNLELFFLAYQVLKNRKKLPFQFSNDNEIIVLYDIVQAFFFPLDHQYKNSNVGLPDGERLLREDFEPMYEDYLTTTKLANSPYVADYNQFVELVKRFKQIDSLVEFLMYSENFALSEVA